MPPYPRSGCVCSLLGLRVRNNLDGAGLGWYNKYEEENMKFGEK